VTTRNTAFAVRTPYSSERDPEVSEDHIVFIFRLEKQTKEEIRKLSLPPASAGFLFELLLDPEDGGDIFLRNTLCHNPDHIRHFQS
jgi:hypothetical protein